MATLLLIVIYIAFIGLGIPDSLFGSAWPAIYQDFNLPFSYANFITVAISVFTVSSSIFSSKIIEKFGTGNVTAFSTLLTAIGLFGFCISSNIWFMLCFSLPLGLGAGCIDSGLNNYVAVNYKPIHMNIINCFYGIGVCVSPFFVSIALTTTSSWRNGYFIIFLVQLLLALLVFLSLPIWKKQKNKLVLTETIEKEKVSYKSILKDKLLYFVCLVFAGTCAVEFCLGTWCTTYLVKIKEFMPETAALCLTFYYAGMTIGRLVSGLLTLKLKPFKIIVLGQIVTFIALLFLFFNLSIYTICITLFFVSFGNGAVFPNLAYLTPKNFGKQASQSVMGIQMASCYVGVTIMPFVFSVVSSAVGMQIFPLFLIIMYCIMATGTVLTVITLKRRNNFEF